MLYDEMPVALPWYDNIAKQDRFKPNCSEDVPYPQLSPSNGLLPFQVKKSAMAERPIHFYIMCSNGVQAYEMGTAVIEALEYATREGFDYITWAEDNNVLMAINLPEGEYYYEMQFSDSIYVSEVIRVPNDRFLWNDPGTCNYPIFEWDNNEADLRPMFYSGSSFKNKLILDTFIQATAPVVEILGEKDGNDELIATFQKVSINYQMIVVVPDYIKVALSVMQIHANATLITDRGLRQGDIKNVTLNATIEEDGAHSILTLHFEQQTILSKVSCNDSLALPDCSGHYIAPPLFGEWVLPDLSLYVKSVTFPDGKYAEVWANNTGAFTRVKEYISAADMRLGVSFPMPAGTWVHVYIVMRTFECEDLRHSATVVPLYSF